MMPGSSGWSGVSGLPVPVSPPVEPEGSVVSVPVPGVSGVAGVYGVGSDGVSDGVSVPGSVSSGGVTISPVSGSIRLPFSSVI